jgi:hypothetical protein
MPVLSGFDLTCISRVMSVDIYIPVADRSMWWGQLIICNLVNPRAAR